MSTKFYTQQTEHTVRQDDIRVHACIQYDNGMRSLIR